MLGLDLRVRTASTEYEITAAFAALAGQGAGALLVGADPFVTSRVDQLVALAARYATRTVVTLDRRHFDVLRPLNGGRFTVLT